MKGSVNLDRGFYATTLTGAHELGHRYGINIGISVGYGIKTGKGLLHQLVKGKTCGFSGGLVSW